MAQTNNAQQNNEIRYLNPPAVEVRKKNTAASREQVSNM